MGFAQIPDAQLDLRATISTDNPDHLTSYRELLFTDNEQELSNGALLDRLIPLLDSNGAPVYEVDDTGELILDVDGNPIPVMVTVGIAPALSVAGSLASSRLFDLFAAGRSHFDWLSNAELKLLADSGRMLSMGIVLRMSNSF